MWIMDKVGYVCVKNQMYFIVLNKVKFILIGGNKLDLDTPWSPSSQAFTFILFFFIYFY